MSEERIDTKSDQEAELLVRRIVQLSIALMLVLMLGGWLLSGWFCARSVCIGGVLATASFWMLKRDIQALMARVSNSSGQAISGPGLGQGFFILKSFARLSILALLLLLVASKVSLHILGLLLGLSTIMVSVILVGLCLDKSSLPSKV